MPHKPHQKMSSHSASSSECVAYLLPTLSLTNEAENSSRTWKRCYSCTPLQRDTNRVRSIPRHPTLQPQEQKSAKTDRTPFAIFFNPALPKISSVVNKYTTLLQSTANCKKAVPNPPVIAYRRNASLLDLLAHSTLSHENSSSQKFAEIQPPMMPHLLDR